MTSTALNIDPPSPDARLCFEALVRRHQSLDPAEQSRSLSVAGSLDDIRWCADTLLSDSRWENAVVHWYALVHQKNAPITDLDGMGPWWSHIWNTTTQNNMTDLWKRLFDVDINAIADHVRGNPHDDITQSFVVTPTACYSLSVLVQHGSKELWTEAMTVLDGYSLPSTDPLHAPMAQRIRMLKHIARTHAVSEGRADIAAAELERQGAEGVDELAGTMMSWALAAGHERVALAVWSRAQELERDGDILKQTAAAVRWLLEDPNAVGVAQAMDVVVLDWMVAHSRNAIVLTEVQHLMGMCGSWAGAFQRAAPHLTALRCKQMLLEHVGTGQGDKERAM